MDWRRTLGLLTIALSVGCLGESLVSWRGIWVRGKAFRFLTKSCSSGIMLREAYRQLGELGGVGRCKVSVDGAWGQRQGALCEPNGGVRGLFVAATRRTTTHSPPVQIPRHSSKPNIPLRFCTNGRDTLHHAVLHCCAHNILRKRGHAQGTSQSLSLQGFLCTNPRSQQLGKLYMTWPLLPPFAMLPRHARDDCL